MTRGVMKSDGSARLNPGPVAIGYLIEADGSIERANVSVSSPTTEPSTTLSSEAWRLPWERDVPRVGKGDSRLVVKQVRVNGA